MGTKIFHLNLPSFHHHNHHQQHGTRRELRDVHIPRGFLAIMVGLDGEQQKFIVPIDYINHPLFIQLLKEAEEEYGFEYEKGLISIPCHVADFQRVQGMIDRASADNHHHQQNHHLPCFRV